MHHSLDLNKLSKNAMHLFIGKCIYSGAKKAENQWGSLRDTGVQIFLHESRYNLVFLYASEKLIELNVDRLSQNAILIRRKSKQS